MTTASSPKIDVEPEWWDNIFAPSSCLVLIWRDAYRSAD